MTINVRCAAVELEQGDLYAFLFEADSLCSQGSTKNPDKTLHSAEPFRLVSYDPTLFVPGKTYELTIGGKT